MPSRPPVSITTLRNLRRRIPSTRGAIDLASIMVGVLVIGIIGSVIAATVFSAIPWAQQQAARGDLDSIRSAESVAYAQSSLPGPAKYLSVAELETAGLLQSSPRVGVTTNAAGTCYVAASRAATGDLYVITSDDPDPKLYKSDAAWDTSWCAPLPAITGSGDPVATASAIKSMWAWGNPVHNSDDARGTDNPETAAGPLSDYAASKNLIDVRVSTPWASSNTGPIKDWLSATVAALHSKSITASALGGSNDWADNPGLVSQWITAAHDAAAFDGVQLDIEPWAVGTPGAWETDTAAVGRFVTMTAQAETTSHALGMKLGIDLPWWLAVKPYSGATIYDAVLAHADSVSVVAFADHADGPDGIIALAQPAVTKAVAAHVPFTVGVETDTAAVAGGPQFTFNDEGSAVLELEASKVDAAFASNPTWRGVSVEHYLSWLALKP